MGPISEDEVRKIFSKMPPDVFDLWLLPRYKVDGWPCYWEDHILKSSNWRNHLKEYPPSFWSKVEWTLETKRLSQFPIEEKAAGKIELLVKTWLCYEKSQMWPNNLLKNSPERIKKVIDYIRANHTIPRRLVCLKLKEHYMLLDGFHRLTALQVIDMADEAVIDVWVGEMAG